VAGQIVTGGRRGEGRQRVGTEVRYANYGGSG
jgi:hypothetical protein